MDPSVDLVVVFKPSPRKTFSKQQRKDAAKKAEQQYSRLLQTLSYTGIKAVGRRSEEGGDILVFLSFPQSHVANLARKERHDTVISSADRIRLVHNYICSQPSEGGLGINSASADWDLISSILPLHDAAFNAEWVHACTSGAPMPPAKIRDVYGDAVALYFSFLSAYTRFLVFPAGLGCVFYVLGSTYSPIYSTLLILWSIIYIQYWRAQERLINIRGGSVKVTAARKRAEHVPGFPWWKRELRMVASLPVILFFAAALTALLTAIFFFEAFVTQLYRGPGHQLVAFSPTILFVLLVPKLLSLYQVYARKLTAWENHTYHSDHAASLTLKTFALGALVAYLGLALSAFVYVPFGESVMNLVQQCIFHLNSTPTDSDSKPVPSALWENSATTARERLNPSRLRDQMFAYSVTNQVVNTFVETGLPFVLRAFGKWRAERANDKNGKSDGKKRVAFSDNIRPTDKKPMSGADVIKAREEEEHIHDFLQRVQAQVALPEYEPFVDYSEMVTQFGYVTVWSCIWPLCPLFSLLNNTLEARSDGIKLTAHHRRPLPISSQTESIGPWLDALEFLSWGGSLVNAALVGMFFGGSSFFSSFSASGVDNTDTWNLMQRALILSLVASHVYMGVRIVVKHLAEKVLLKEEARFVDPKSGFLDVSGAEKGAEIQDLVEESVSETDKLFFSHDEGLEEIRRMAKEA